MNYRKTLESLMDAAGVSMGEASRIDEVLSKIAREAGVQPNDLVLYEEETDDGKVTIHVGARAPREQHYTPYASLADAEGGANHLPKVMDDPWEDRPKPGPEFPT